MHQTSIHWFRRDLRISDNPALTAAVNSARQVVPVYILSAWQGPHRWTGENRQQFLCACLRSLAGNLEALGSRLIIRTGDPVDELCQIAAEAGAAVVHALRDPDPHGRRIEDRLAGRLREQGVGLHLHKGVCVRERDEVLTVGGEPFRVFTPYSKAWRKLPTEPPLPAPRRLPPVAPAIRSLPLPALDHWRLPGRPGNLPEAGERAARDRMRRFLDGAVADYGNLRDIPAAAATSRLSQDLRFGLLAARELVHRCREVSRSADAAGRAGIEKFVSEIIWREFYIQLLWHFPEVLEQEFSPKFRGMPWPGRQSDLERWQNGETGFPIVDAAMRELRATGFMHNRMRMIAAMFLTKDLHLDWRAGEAWFMRQLVDGEIASNNGGWQWSAGTGADAAPYFRIQNPWLQTARYDPQGAYIKRWVPELRAVDPRSFQSPPANGRSLATGYPQPMVDHAAERDRTLERFNAWSRRSG